MLRFLILLSLLSSIPAHAQLGNATSFRGRPLSATAPTNGQVYAWNSAANRWEPATGGGGSGCTVPGSDTQVLFNDGGNCGADAGFTYNKATDTVSLAGSLLTGVGGSAAGAIAFTQGSAPSAGTTNITLYAPAAVTSHTRRFAGAAATGISLWTNTAGDMVEVITSTTGTGNIVRAADPTITGHPTIEGVTSTGATGTGAFVFGTSPTISGPTVTGVFTAAGATSTAPAKVGNTASLPATCTVGQIYFSNNATAGQNLFFCTTTDNWTQQLNSGSGGMGCTTAGSAGQFLVDDGAGGCTSLTLLTRTSNTIAGGAALTFDLSASTALKAPGSLATGLLHVTTTTGAVVGGLLVAADVTAGTLTPATMNVTARAADFGGEFSGGGSALTSGSVAGSSLVYRVVPYACTVVGWSVAVDAGTAGFRVWRKAAGTAVPTAADTVTSVGDLAISTGTVLESITSTNWSGGAFPSFAANDILAFQLNAAATATYAAFGIYCQK